MKCSIKLIFLAFVLAQISYASSEDYVCPNLEVSEDTSDPFISQSLKRELTHEIWNSPQLSSPTELVAQLRDIILDMADSDSFYFSEIAFQFTGWSTCFLAEASHIYPSYCPFATVINATAEWQSTGDVYKYIEALNETVDAVPYAFSALTHASLDELGCQNVSDPISRSKSCYQNGLVSNQDAIWEVFGRLMPWPLRNVAQLLIESPLFSDRAYATILTFVLTPPQYYYFSHQRYPLLYESARLYVNAANNSKCCCDDWNARMGVLNDIHNQTAVDNAKIKIDELLHECN